MNFTIRDVPINALRFDPDNPRFWFHDPRPQTQDDIFIALAERGRTMIEYVANGLYAAVEPLLVCPHEDEFTVVDGNLRLFAVRTLADPEFADHVRQMAPLLNPPTIESSAAADLRNVTVAVFPTWDEAYPVRLHRQAMSGRRWQSPFTSAHDFRRLSEQGMSIPRIGTCYHLYPQMVERQIQTLNLFEQLGQHDPPDWRRRHEFSKLSAALEMPSIRQHLGLREPSEAGSRERPLSDDEAVTRARQLLSIINGADPQEHQPNQRPAVELRDGSMDALNRIYGDPKALRRLLDSPRSSVQDITRWMDGVQNPYRIREISSDLHGVATECLKSIKDEKPDQIPDPGNISVARTAYSIYNDGSAQYVVTLLSRTPEAHQRLPAELKRRIKQEGYDCSVHIE